MIKNTTFYGLFKLFLLFLQDIKILGFLDYFLIQLFLKNIVTKNNQIRLTIIY
jgi:hypothetical protein